LTARRIGSGAINQINRIHLWIQFNFLAEIPAIYSLNCITMGTKEGIYNQNIVITTQKYLLVIGTGVDFLYFLS